LLLRSQTSSHRVSGGSLYKARKEIRKLMKREGELLAARHGSGLPARMARAFSSHGIEAQVLPMQTAGRSASAQLTSPTPTPGGPQAGFYRPRPALSVVTPVTSPAVRQ